MNDSILLANAERLGIRDPSTIKKAEVFIRILNTKPVGKTMTDTGKLIMCLDLAATNLGVSFDKTAALKLSGLKKGPYQNSLNNIEKILNLDKPITVNDLCIQFDCTEVKELAENILIKYHEHDKKIKDINHPQYIAAAVYTSCRLNKIKVDKSRFKSISRLKPTQWNELIKEFENFASALEFMAEKRDSAEETSHTDYKAQNEDAGSVNDQKKAKEVQIEDYEIWKQRILREATIEILQNEINE